MELQTGDFEDWEEKYTSPMDEEEHDCNSCEEEDDDLLSVIHYKTGQFETICDKCLTDWEMEEEDFRDNSGITLIKRISND